MKTTLKSLIALATFFLSLSLVAQEFTAGINTETPNPNAVLHLVAPNGDQGLLIPSLTTAQRTAMNGTLTPTDNGLMVFDSDANAFYFWVNPNWVLTTNTDNQNLTLAGNNLTIDNGNTIDLSSINTDNQNLTLAGTNLSLDRGNTVDLTTAGFVVTESDPTVPANIKDGIDYSELSGIPANIDIDATDDLTLSTAPAAGDIIGDFQTGLNINVGSVTTAEIADGTITNVDIGDVAVGKITGAPNLDTDATNDLTTADIGTATGNVVTLSGPSTLPALDGSALTGVTAAIAANSITGTELANDAVGSTEILDGSIADIDINVAANIAASKLDANVMTQGENVSLLNNDAGYVLSGDNVSIFTNDAGYLGSGANVSVLVNDAGYITGESQDISTDASPGNISITGGSTISINVDDADNSPTNEIQDALAVAYDNTGDLVITTANVEAALKELDASVAAGDGDNSPTNEIQDALAVAYDNTGDLIIASASVEGALKDLDASVAAGDGDNSPTNEIQDALAVAYDNTGDLIIASASVEGALKDLDASVAAGDGDNSPTNEIQDALAVAYDNTGDLIITTLNVESALKELDASVAAGDGDNSPTNEIQDALAVAYDNTGDLIIASASVEGALKDLDASVAAGDGDNSPTNEIQDALAVAYDNTGDLIITTLNVESALKELDASVAAGDGDNSPTNEIQDALAVAYDNTGDLIIASASVEGALKDLDASVAAGDGDNSPTNEIQDALAVAYDNTGDLIITTLNVESALKELDASVAAGDGDNSPTNEIQDALAVAYDNTGDLIITTLNVESALKELDASVAAGDGDNSPTNEIQDALAVAYDNTGDLIITTLNVESALKELDASVAAGDGDNSPTNEIQDALGVAYDNTGDLVITTANVEAALKELDASVAAGDGDNSPTNEIQDALAVAYDNTGDLVITTLNVESALKELDGAVAASTLNSGNGVTINTNNIDLGGALSAPATITTGAGSNDLIINGAGVLDVDAIADFSVNASFSSIDVTGGAISGVNLTQVDNFLTFEDDGDGSKQATFELSGISPATSRQYMLPDQNGTLALLADIGPSDFFIDINENNLGGNSLSTPAGNNNIILGFNSGPGLTSGSDNILLGTGSNNSVGTTGGNVAIGNNADANGGDAIAIGTNTSADAANAVAIGTGTVANIPNTIVLGDGIASNFLVGIGVQDVRAPLQIGGEFGMGHFENITETINGDAIMSNLYPDYSNATINQLRRTNSDSASFIFFDNGEILFMNVVNGAPDSQVDLSDAGTDVRSWMSLRNTGNIDISEGIRIGSPDPGDEEDGMIRFNGSGFDGYFSGGWNPLGGGLALPYSPGSVANAADLFFIEQTGSGGAGRFQVNNGASTVNALSVESNGGAGSRAMHVINSGAGDAGEFTISGGGNGAAVQANTDGTGVAGSFAITNASNASNSLVVTTSGVGGALSASVNNGTSSGSAIFASTSGTGSGVNVNHTGTTGRGIVVDMNGSSSNAAIEVLNSNGPSIITDGNVGIGFSSPRGPLDVNVGINTSYITGNSNVATGLLQVENAGTGDASIRFDVPGNNTVLGIDQTDGATFKINMGALLTDGVADFAISSLGDVGIGTATPSAKLEVNGNFATASDISLGGNLISAVSGPFNVDPVASDTRIVRLDGGPIAQITAGLEGQEIILVSAAVGVDIIDADNGGNNIQLSNNDTNFLMNVNATLHLVYIGSFWIEVGRSAQL